MIINSCGTEIHIVVTGSGAPPLLLLHGWGCSSSLMKPVADILCKSFTCYAVDFPGHGKSGRPPEPWGVPEYSNCLLDVIKQLGIYGCPVIAHSFGGRITAWLAAENPDIFSKIILTGAAGIRKEVSAETSKRTNNYKRYKNILEKVSSVPGMKTLTANMQEKLIQHYGSPDYAALDPEMRKTFVKVINQDLSVCYSGISCPTLLIWGKDDDQTPLWMAQKMEKLIPDAGLVTLDGDHFAYLKQLGSFTLICSQFLTGV